MIENGSMSESNPTTRELKKLQLISYCPLATTSLGGVQFVQVNFDSLEVQDSPSQFVVDRQKDCFQKKSTLSRRN
jgi:hypothetical protein